MPLHKAVSPGTLDLNPNWSEIFEYRDGFLYWQTGLNRSHDGSIHQYPTGQPIKQHSRTSKGYTTVQWKKKKYSSHNIIWELHFGPIPSGLTVDHIDRNPSNNLISNLRLATPTQQNANTRKWSTSTTASRFKGVCAWRKPGKWRLFFKGKYIGLFASDVSAALKYNEMALAEFGEFACLNQLPQIFIFNKNLLP